MIRDRPSVMVEKRMIRDRPSVMAETRMIRDRPSVMQGGAMLDRLQWKRWRKKANTFRLSLLG